VIEIAEVRPFAKKLIRQLNPLKSVKRIRLGTNRRRRQYPNETDATNQSCKESHNSSAWEKQISRKGAKAQRQETMPTVPLRLGAFA
jgi:hypothetical protein